jgi:hypothetical protein
MANTALSFSWKETHLNHRKEGVSGVDDRRGRCRSHKFNGLFNKSENSSRSGRLYNAQQPYSITAPTILK